MNRIKLPTRTAASLLLAPFLFSASWALPAADTTPGPESLPSTDRLARLVPGQEIGQPESTPAAGVFRVKVGGSYVYLTADGGHVLTGDLLDLNTGENLTELQRSGERLALVGAYSESDLVLFAADGEEKARVLVFTDTSCPYCRKLHEEVPALQQAGVTVGYIPFPRGGQGSKGERELRAVWCAEDRVHALNIAKGMETGALGAGDCAGAAAIDTGYRLGVQLGVRGTPTIVLPDGAVLPGYVKAAELLQRLGIDVAAGR